jgi:hypothetical protein
MSVQVRLVDVNPAMVEAWGSSFADLPGVQTAAASFSRLVWAPRK